MTETPSRPRWIQVLIAVGKALAYLALFLGWQVLVSTVYSTVISIELAMANPFVSEFELYEVLMAKSMEISLLSGLLTLGSLAVFFRLRRRPLRRELCLEPVSGAVFGWCAALSFCLYWLVVLVLSGLPESWMGDYVDVSSSLDQTGAVAVLATALVAPVVEEVVFRGLVFTRLRRELPGWMAVVLSAAVFGACHGEFVWFCYAFVLGVVFALLVEKTHSILPGMLMHVVFNSTSEALTLLGEDWELGGPGVLIVLVLATAGTVFCALQARNAVRKLPVPVKTEQTAAIQAEQYAEPEGRREQPLFQRPGPAVWDPDSGPGHRFPPQRM